MLRRAKAIEHSKTMTSGKTRPSIMVAELADRSTVELVAKFSAGCDEKESSLAREAIAACLAGDLGLPIPEPYLVDVPAALSTAIADPDLRRKVADSSPVAFGLRFVKGGYSIWHSGVVIDDAMLPVAAAIFVFDLITQNVDRRVDNPNCFVKGSQIVIFDHELAFTHGLVLGWKPPWVTGGLQDFQLPGKHIFREGLMRCRIDYGPIRAAWANLQDARLAMYQAQIPPEWTVAAPAVKKAIDLVRNARDNIDGCLKEVQRVLT